MKKSARIIYARPVLKKRGSWRSVLVLAGLAALCAVIVFHDDERMAGFLAAASSPERYDAPVDVSPEELAASAAADKRADPNLLLATVGEAFDRAPGLRSIWPSFGMFGDQADADVADAAPALSGPQPYAKNDRYTVELLGGESVYRGEIARGDTAGALLAFWMSQAEAAAVIQAAAPVYSLANLREGNPLSVVHDESGAFVRFVYDIDAFRRLVVTRTDDTFQASAEKIAYDTELAHVRGDIDSSLFEAVTSVGENATLAMTLADVFSCEINFINELRRGDSFDLLVEKHYSDGEFKGYGRMVAARFTNQGRAYEAFLFADASGKERYYNAEGDALQRSLLKAPLSFTRVSSGYSMNRRHPVLGYSRPHQGVDYAAPSGTPIKAVGEGVATKVGWGNGYGNMIVIRHAGGLESQYAHMSGFAKGIKAGTRVNQGQTIGYVGATGIATGPHLDFRLRQNGQFINPSKVIVPRADPVAKTALAHFRDTVAQCRAYLAGATALAEYKPKPGE